MAPNPEPFGLLWNEKFVQLLEAVEICNMQCMLKSTQDWVAFLNVNPRPLFMQNNSNIHYNTRNDFPLPEEKIVYFLILSWFQLIIP